MFTFDDTDKFVKVLALKVPWAHSYAEMQPGRTDRERRENYRNAALGKAGADTGERIVVGVSHRRRKSGPRPPVKNTACFRAASARRGRRATSSNCSAM